MKGAHKWEKAAAGWQTQSAAPNKLINISIAEVVGKDKEEF